MLYRGIVCERRARTHLNKRSPGSSFEAYEWIRQAMEWYGKAEAIRPEDNDEAILRWNTCVRIMQHDKLKPRPDDDFQHLLE